MTSGGPFPFFNSKEVEYADIQMILAGSPTGKFTGVKYGVKTTKQHLHAGGDDPIGIQSGNREPSGTITALKSVLDVMNAAAITAGGRDITDISFDIQITYKPAGTRPLQTDTLVGCQFSDFEKGMKQGDLKMEVELPFLFLQLVTQ